MQEENELFRLENREMKTALKNIEAKINKEIVTSEIEKEKKADEIVGKFRHQAQIQEENLQIIKEQYMRLQQIYLSKIKNLEDNLEKEKRMYDNLKQRRDLEIEGFHRDIKDVKRKTKIYDEYLYRIKKLVNNESHENVQNEGEDSNEENEEDVKPLKDQVERLESELDQIRARHPDMQPEREELKEN